MSTTEVCTCTDVSASGLQQLYCPTAGRDTTGNFALSYKGMAVRTDCNRFIAFRGRPADVRLYDVTGLTLPGCDSLVYRVPVTEEQVHEGDLVLISDCPFEVLYITNVSEIKQGRVRGINQSGEVRTVYLPKQLGDCARFTRIYSVFDALRLNPGEMSEEQIAFYAAVLCCHPGNRSGSADFLTALLAENVADKGFDRRQVGLLVALQQGNCLESFILTRALQGTLDPLAEEHPGAPAGPAPRKGEIEKQTK